MEEQASFLSSHQVSPIPHPSASPSSTAPRAAASSPGLAKTPFQLLSDFVGLGDTTARLGARLRSEDVVISAGANVLVVALALGLFLVYKIMEQFVRPMLWALLVGAVLFPLKSRIKSSLGSWLPDRGFYVLSSPHLSPAADDKPGNNNSLNRSNENENSNNYSTASNERRVLYRGSHSSRSPPQLLVVTLFASPGRIASACVHWTLDRWVQFLLLGISVAATIFVERFWDVFAQVLSTLPSVFDVISTALERMADYAARSFFQALLFCVLFGAPLIFLMRNSASFVVVVRLLQFILLLIVVPTLYSFFPTTTFLSLGTVVLFMLFGIGRHPKCPTCKKWLKNDDALEMAANGRWFHRDCFVCRSCQNPVSWRGSTYRETERGIVCISCLRSTNREHQEEFDSERMSSTIVYTLGVAGVCIMLQAYLLKIVAFVVVLSQVNRVVSAVFRFLQSSGVSQRVLQLMYPPDVLWEAYLQGDLAVQRYVKRHVDAIATLLTLIVFVVAAVSISMYFSVWIYREGRAVAELAKETWDVWNARYNLVPADFNQTLSSFLTEHLQWAQAPQFIRIATAMFGNSTSPQAPTWGSFNFTDVHSLVGRNFSSVTSALYAVKDGGRVVVGYVAYMVYALLTTTTSAIFTLAVFVTTLFYLLSASSGLESQQTSQSSAGEAFGGAKSKGSKKGISAKASAHVGGSVRRENAQEEFLPYVWIQKLPYLKKNGWDKAVIEAIESVFHSTVMVAVFHGLFTWVSFSVLQARFVHISTLMSFFMAMLPFVGPYWVAVPGTIDLFLRSANAGPAIALVLSHVIVYWFVDPIIYEEIDGSHPYLTALAVVGGLYLFGAEGILLGPIVLVCCLKLWDNIPSQQDSANASTIGGTETTPLKAQVKGHV